MYRGIVQKGGREASAFGFPTLNIPLQADVRGIFAAHVSLEGTSYEAVAYADVRGKKLEAHLFNFSGDAYGKEVRIELLEKLREDRTFASAEEAKQTIAEDAANARAYFMKKR